MNGLLFKLIYQNALHFDSLWILITSCLEPEVETIRIRLLFHYSQHTRMHHKKLNLEKIPLNKNSFFL